MTGEGPSDMPKQPEGQLSAAKKRKQHRSRLQRRGRNNSTVFGSTADFASVTGRTEEEAAKYEERAAQKRDEDYEKNATPEERALDDLEHQAMEQWVAEAKKKTDEKQKHEGVSTPVGGGSDKKIKGPEPK